MRTITLKMQGRFPKGIKPTEIHVDPRGGTFTLHAANGERIADGMGFMRPGKRRR